MFPSQSHSPSTIPPPPQTPHSSISKVEPQVLSQPPKTLSPPHTPAQSNIVVPPQTPLQSWIQSLFILESQTPHSSKYPFPLQIPHSSGSALPPQTPTQSSSQSLFGLSSHTPQLSYTALPPSTPSQSTGQGLNPVEPPTQILQPSISVSYTHLRAHET